MNKRSEKRREHVESNRLVETAFELARSLDISQMLVQADELQDIRIIEELREEETIVWLTRGNGETAPDQSASDRTVKIPNTTLTRMSQLKVGLLYGIMNEHIALDETILCLSGVAGSQRIDTLLVTNPQRDFPWFRKSDVQETRRAVATREFVRIVEIALRLAREGREGKPVGTIFVLADKEKLSPYLSQLVLNPCEGHAQKRRNIHDEGFFETIREFAALDGAFVINNRGVVESAGTYLNAPLNRAKVVSGLGARHMAAAALTATTDAVAVVVSESSGTVMVFHEGDAILELERPQTTPHPV